MIYIEYIKNAFRSQFRYRLNWGMNLLGGLIATFFQICLWSALLKNHDGTVTMEYMLGYILISGMIQALIKTNTAGMINNKIRSGQIAMDFIKPIRFKRYIFCESLGERLFSVIFSCLPVTVFFTVLYRGYAIWQKMDLFFIISVFLGLYLYFSISYCLGVTSFWGTQTWILERFLNDTVSLFSGKILPVWMLPGAVLVWNRWLPFQYTYYTPISMLLNPYSVGEKMNLICIQVIWCVFFSILGAILEKKGRRKLQVQGG